MIRRHEDIRWVLELGSHENVDEGVCLLEVVALLAGEGMTDHPLCVSAVLAQYGRDLNDGLNDVDRQRLVPLAPRLVGTADDGLDGLRRSLAAAWLDRYALPHLRRVAGVESDDVTASVVEEADELYLIARMRLEKATRRLLPTSWAHPAASLSRHIDVVIGFASAALAEHEDSGDVFGALFAAAVVECREGSPGADGVDHVSRSIILGEEVGKLLSRVVACHLVHDLAQVIASGLEAEAPDAARPIAFGSSAYLAAERSVAAVIEASFVERSSPLHPLPALFRDEAIALFERMIDPATAGHPDADEHEPKRRDNTAFTPTL